MVKMLLKDPEENVNKQKGRPCSQFKMFDIIKMLFFLA